MIDKGSRIHTCDKCGKEIAKWGTYQLVGRTYRPGYKHDICSSDINMFSTKIADLCHKCWHELIAEFVREG